MNFFELGLSKKVAVALEALGFAEPTDIQQRVFHQLLPVEILWRQPKPDQARRQLMLYL